VTIHFQTIEGVGCEFGRIELRIKMHVAVGKEQNKNFKTACEGTLA